MPVTIEPENPADVWAVSEWEELVQDQRPGTSTHAPQQTTATETIVVPTHKVRSAITKILGYSFCDQGSKLLTRPEVPLRHPWYRHLWAEAVTVSEQAPVANPDREGSAAGLYKPEKAADADVNWAYGPDWTANHLTSLLTVTFRAVPWKVWRDDDPDWQDFYEGEEWRRMVACVGSSPQLDLLTAEGTDEFTLYYAEKDAANPVAPDSPTLGTTSFPGSVYFRKVQSLYEVVWRGVEEQYLTGPYDPAATEESEDIDDGLILPNYRRLDRYLGCVNDRPFFGHKRGTILFDGYKPVRYPFPGVRTNTSFGLMGVDVYLYFRKLDPPTPETTQSVTGAVIPAADRRYGHQTLPFRSNPSRFWFAATAGSDTTKGRFDGAFPLEELDLYELFRHPDDPLYPLP